jgi:hypothetical protein
MACDIRDQMAWVRRVTRMCVRYSVSEGARSEKDVNEGPEAVQVAREG